MTPDPPPPDQPSPDQSSPDQSGPARPGDELVSAVLDGEATPEERRRVGADPALSARLGQFRTVADVLAQAPPRLDQDQREALVTAALGASEAPSPAPPVVLAARRASRARRFPPAGLVAAAVVVLMALGAVLILNGRNDHRSNSASRPTGIGGATDEPGNQPNTKSGAFAPAPSAGQGTTKPVPSAPFVGTFTQPEDLRTALKPLDPRTLQPQAPPVDSSTSSTPTTSGDTGTGPGVIQAQVGRCDGVVRANEPGLGAPLAFALARVGQRIVIVISYPLAATPERVREYAVDAGSCVPLLAVDR